MTCDGYDEVEVLRRLHRPQRRIQCHPVMLVYVTSVKSVYVCMCTCVYVYACV